MLRSSINIQLQCIKRSVAHRRRQILSNKRGWLRNFSWPRTHHNNRSKISRRAHWGKKNGHFTWMLLCNTQSFLNRDCQWFGNPSVLNQGLQLNNNHPDECYLYVYANPFILNNNWSNLHLCVLRSITHESWTKITKPPRKETKRPRPYKYKMS